MKREIELKFFVDDLEIVKKRLKNIGAKCSWAGKQTDVFLDFPSNRLKGEKAELRVRTFVPYQPSLLTYKEKFREVRGAYKSMDEYETTVKDPNELKRILGKLGFKVVFTYTKPRREYWDLPDAVITLDSYPFGKFAEIESTPKSIKRIAKKLGLDLSNTSTKSYGELLKKSKL